MFRDRAPVLLFVVAVLAHLGFALGVGQSAPAGRYQDVNVYLELAQNLWHEGFFGSRVNNRPYPPGYPMAIAPTFALSSNAARFAATYVLHTLWLALACLALLPMLRDALDRRRAWLALALLQGIAGASFTLLHAQSEAIYGPLLITAAGLLYTAFRDGRAATCIAAGVFVGLALATRRIGVVAPLSLVLVIAHDLVGAWRSGTDVPWRRAGALVFGVTLGLTPEVLGSVLSGGFIDAYPEYTTGYAKASGQALVSLDNAVYTGRIAATQLAYYVLITLGAPVFIASFLWLRWRGAPTPDEPDAIGLARQRTMQWVAYAALGTGALTTIHIVRHVFGSNVTEGFSTYPRYLDPLEIPMVVCGFVAAVSLARRDRGEAWRTLSRFGLLATAFALAAGPWYRTRAGRLPPLRRLEEWGFGPVAPWMFAIACFVVLGLAWALWRARRAHTLGGLVAVVALSWGLSAHVPARWITKGVTRDAPARLLTSGPLQIEGEARPPGLCVVVDRQSRRFYKLAFRTEHRVWFTTPKEIAECVEERGADWVVTRAKGRWAPTPGRAPDVTGKPVTAGKWQAWRVTAP